MLYTRTARYLYNYIGTWYIFTGGGRKLYYIGND